ncbi:hypothetical protein [Aeromicrobium sp. 9AM]|uniref:hypothetical protein n=1 Tax=Aeromicrobium sp. 9AM TaxID=2653126 RepID=UPI0012F32E04|nr:hypothetical protein [Aeromicrobium sp. 9AM]VXC53069.1 conserved hypothetical protein [Aeromicrobium sp. 9AM]
MSEFGYSDPRRTDNPYDPVQVGETTAHRQDALERDSQFQPHVGRLRRLLNRLKRR